MLLRQSYFEKHLLPKIQAVTSEKASAHQLFHLTVANDVQLPVKMYMELDISLLGLTGAECWHTHCRGSIPGAGQKTPVEASWYCRMESNLAILQCIC